MRKRGRPPVAPELQRCTPAKTYLNDEELDKLKKAQRRHGQTEAGVLRLALRRLDEQDAASR